MNSFDDLVYFLAGSSLAVFLFALMTWGYYAWIA